MYGVCVCVCVCVCTAESVFAGVSNHASTLFPFLKVRSCNTFHPLTYEAHAGTVLEHAERKEREVLLARRGKETTLTHAAGAAGGPGGGGGGGGGGSPAVLRKQTSNLSERIGEGDLSTHTGGQVAGGGGGVDGGDGGGKEEEDAADEFAEDREMERRLKVRETRD